MTGEKDKAYAGLPADGKLSLLFPFDFEGAKVTRLDVRRPKMKDELRKAKTLKEGKSDIFAVMELLAELISKPFEFMTELDPVDFERLQGVYAGFLPEHMIAG